MVKSQKRSEWATGVLDPEDEDDLTIVGGETALPRPPAVNEDDVAKVAEAIGNTGAQAHHPDGPGVGGD